MDIDGALGELLGPPEVVAEGLLAVDEAPGVLRKAQAAALKAVKAMEPRDRCNEAATAETLRVALRRFFQKRCDVKPVVIVRVAVIEA
jgi:mRNA degradation ribonuclease J1/J2